MKAKKQTLRIIRWLLSAVLVFIGLSTTWAWGEVARLAEPDPAAAGPQETALYGIWQPEQARRPGLYRSTDAGQSWQLLSLPAGTVPLTWANDGERLAVATDSLTVVSTDGGESWATTIDDLNVVSLAWGDSDLYLGTRDQGVHRLPPGASTPAPISAGEVDLQAVPVTHLAVARAEAPTGERLFAASANTVYYTDDGGRTWQRSTPVEDWISTLAVVDKDQIYVGGETAGVYRSLDAGQSWQPARKGLGLAPGQMVKVTALRADPAQPGVLYSAVDHVLGSTQAHASAAGAFVSLDGGTSWSPLAGPAFPQAQHASSLVLVPGSPLHVHAVTANGLQAYAPDIAAALTALDSPEPACLTLPTGELLRPHPQFQAVATMNGDPDNELPVALRDRFPVCIEITDAHPNGIGSLPQDLQAAASGSVCAVDPDRRITLRAWLAFASLRNRIGSEAAAKAVFRSRGQDILDALKIAVAG